MSSEPLPSEEDASELDAAIDGDLRATIGALIVANIVYKISVVAAYDIACFPTPAAEV